VQVFAGTATISRYLQVFAGITFGIMNYELKIMNFWVGVE